MAAFQRSLEDENLEQEASQDFTAGHRRVPKAVIQVLTACGVIVGAVVLSYVVFPVLMASAVAAWALGMVGCMLYLLSSLLQDACAWILCKLTGRSESGVGAAFKRSTSNHQKTATEIFADFEYRVVVGGATREDARSEADRKDRMAKLRANVCRAALS